MFFGEEVSRKTHGVCFLREKQAKNPRRKLIGMSRREKCVFGRRSKQKNTRRVFLERKASKKTQNRKFQVNFRVDFCISTKIYI